MAKAARHRFPLRADIGCRVFQERARQVGATHAPHRLDEHMADAFHHIGPDRPLVECANILAARSGSPAVTAIGLRSDERRGGTEGVSACSDWRRAYNKKNKK